MKKVMIIAEVGVNHNGDLEAAKHLIYQAKEAGADAVKFQLFHADTLASSLAPLADYQRQVTGHGAKDQRQMLLDLELGLEDLALLEHEAFSIGIDFLVSIFDADSVSTARKMFQSKFLKIPSGEINNEDLIREAAKTNFSLILSTGMSVIYEVQRAGEWIRESRGSLDNLTILHCTSNYPTAATDVNLRSMLTIARVMGVPVGYSDHTRGTVAALGAVAMGASVLEKHITLDRGSRGPDHLASAGPEEFRRYVKMVRELEQALGSDAKQPTSGEEEIKKVVRKSPFASREIVAGEVFSRDNISLMRPQVGLDASALTELLGKRAKKAYSTGDVLEQGELLDP